jgi:serine phosphatase RsbU (regulator of sigma subunit)
MSVAQELPEANALIRNALQGKSDGMLLQTSAGNVASVAHTIWSKDRKPLGAVYLQVPAGDPPDPNLIPRISAILLPSAVMWLCLMLPIGLVFGVLTTRGMIQRIERLADATNRFSEGDFSVRVPVKKPDEIGGLEQQFNGMAGQLVDSFAQRQAHAEQSARQEERARIEQEMRSAQYVQESLLPDEVPSIAGWQIEPFYCPARQVGGDLYDFLTLPNGQIGIVIGDVSGKGMPAALMMATTCTMIRAASRGDFSPGELLAVVNDLLIGNTTPNMFVTCFYAILDPASGLLRFANAGHSLPVLTRNGEIIELMAKGMPLGLMPEQSYPDQEIYLQSGDSILFYTDGLVESHNREMDMFGTSRLQDLLKEHSHEDGLLEYLLKQLDEFTGAVWEQEDDIALIKLRRNA